jgi:hypothetical protein
MFAAFVLLHPLFVTHGACVGCRHLGLCCVKGVHVITPVAGGAIDPVLAVLAQLPVFDNIWGCFLMTIDADLSGSSGGKNDQRNNNNQASHKKHTTSCPLNDAIFTDIRLILERLGEHIRDLLLTAFTTPSVGNILAVIKQGQTFFSSEIIYNIIRNISRFV